jgi:hypothetical protein
VKLLYEQHHVLSVEVKTGNDDYVFTDAEDSPMRLRGEASAIVKVKCETTDKISRIMIGHHKGNIYITTLPGSKMFYDDELL